MHPVERSHFYTAAQKPNKQSSFEKFGGKSCRQSLTILWGQKLHSLETFLRLFNSNSHVY